MARDEHEFGDHHDDIDLEHDDHIQGIVNNLSGENGDFDELALEYDEDHLDIDHTEDEFEMSVHPGDPTKG